MKTARTVKIALCAVLVVMFMSFQVQDAKAYSYDYNIGDRSVNTIDPSTIGGPATLSDFLSFNGASFIAYDTSQGFSEAYNAYFIGYRAGHINTFTDGNSQFITDPDAATGTHSTAGDFFGIKTATAQFDDTSDHDPTGVKIGNTSDLSYYILKDTWNYTGNSGVNLTFYTGDIIVGFGDNAGDNDNLDLVIALTPTQHDEVPIPAAIWLLGSGLLGLVGIRRRRKI